MNNPSSTEVCEDCERPIDECECSKDDDSD